MPSVLFIFSSADKTLKGKPTGWYLPEAAHPYYELVKDCDITFASPIGPNPPLDPESVEDFKEDAQSVQFLHDETVKQKLATCKTLIEVNVADFDAVFYVGGHGPMLDLAIDTNNAKLLEEAYKQDKIIAAVCHGPGALVSASVPGKLHITKESIFKGKKVTGFSNFEEEQRKMVDHVPFLLEDRLIELGGDFSKHEEAWKPYVVVDGKLITGQNPASAAPLAEALRKALAAKAV